MGETPSAAEEMTGVAPGDRLGKYVLEVRLGSGGMGEVWKAHDASLDRPVAVKVLKSLGGDEIARFRREAHVAARLSHPNIAAVHEVGEDRGRHFIAMQFIEGRTLKDVPRKDRRALVAYVRDAARALDFAHATGIVHRDVKPENVMVAPDGHVYVMDFGLARHRAGAGLTATGIVLGTPPYMAPEQAHGGDVDRRTDVFALGATLYELLTGKKAFEGTSDLETLRRVCESDPRWPRSVDATIDADLQTIVLKCLEKEPRARYPRAGTLADELDRWLAGEPIAARPLGRVARLGRWMRQHRAGTAAVAVVTVVVIVAAVALVVQRVRASRREASDRALAAMWSRIVERKRELRLAKTSPQAARDGLAEAVRDLDAHVRAWPDDPRAWYARARGRLYQHDTAGATEDARAAIERDPSFRAAWTLVGMAKMEEALVAFQVPGARPRGVALVREAGEAFASGGVSAGLPATREDDVLANVARALRLWYVEEKERDARAVLESAIASYRAEEYAFWLGVWSKGAEQERWLGLAVAWAPGYADALRHLAIVTADAKRAVELCSAAIEARPDLALTYVTRGQARLRLEDPVGAARDATRALELGAVFAEVYALRGAAWLETGDMRAARSDCDQALALDASHGSARRARMFLRYDAGDWNGAVEDATALIETGRSLPDAHMTRARALAGLNRLEEARRDCDRAVELQPDADAFQLRGHMRLQMSDDPAAAKSDFDRALELRSGDPLSHYLRGVARERLGDRAGPAADYEAALRHAPADWPHRAEVEKRLAAVRR